MHKDYMPSESNLHGLLDHLVEELSETIQAAMKIQRFGFESDWDGKTNLDRLKEELNDVDFTRNRLMKSLEEHFYGLH